MAMVGVVTVMALNASVGAAQTDRAAIEGRIADESGGVLPGVTVAITSAALQTPELAVVSEANGRYRFTGLPTGTYTLVASLQGFDTARRENIRLTTGFVATIDVALSVGTVTENITVSGAAPVVDIRSTNVSSTFTREALEAVPTARQIWQIMDLSPGIRMRSAVPDVGGSTAGLQQRYVTYGSGRGGNRPMLEGIDMHEQTEAGPFYFDYGAFEEMQIKAMANDAEIPVAGMSLQAIVKSGGNQFHGGGLYQIQKPSLQSSNIDDEQRANGLGGGNRLDDYYDAGLDLGGRVVRDRLWFYGALRQTYNSSQRAGFALAPGPDGRYGTGDDVPGLAEVSQTVYTSKVTAQLSQNHKLVGFYTRSDKENPAANGGAFTPLEATYTQNFNNNGAKGEWNWVPTSRSVVNLFAGRNWWTNMGTNYSPDVPSRFDTVTQFWSGAGFRANNPMPFPYSPHRERMQYTGSYSYYLADGPGGSHEFKIGGEYVDELYSTTTFTRPNGNDFLLRYANGVPFEVVLYNTPYNGQADMTTLSAYVKDSWRIGERLTANVGVRLDRYVSFIPEQTKPEGRFYPSLQIPHTDVAKWLSIVPRLGVAYSLNQAGTTAIKASYGRFGFLQSTDYAKAYNPNDLASTTYRWSDLNGNNVYDPGEEGQFISTTGAGVAIMNPDIGQPMVDEVTGTIEHELMPNLAVRGSYIFKRESNLYQRVPIQRTYDTYNIPITATDPGPDGAVGTTDDGSQVTYYDFDPAVAGAAFSFETDANVPGYTDKFHNYELAMTRRLAGRWQMMGSFLATKRDVWRAGIPMDPNIESFFPKDQTWEWNVKLSGSYRLPGDVQFAGSWTRSSGTPWAREVRFTQGLRQQSQLIVLMEPLGTQRTPTIDLVTARLEKRIQVRGTQTLLQFDVFNALNTNTETGFNARSGATYGRITGSVPPRIARVGVAFTF